ncbi:MAG: hypothetical protein Q9199_004438 [Rusavskia elegans]
MTQTLRTSHESIMQAFSSLKAVMSNEHKYAERISAENVDILGCRYIRWAGVHGLFCEKRNPLDHRLRNNGELKEAIIGLLTNLLEVVERTEVIVSGREIPFDELPPEPESEDEDEDDAEEDEVAECDAIEDGNDSHDDESIGELPRELEQLQSSMDKYNELLDRYTDIMNCSAERYGPPDWVFESDESEKEGSGEKEEKREEK